MILDKIHIQLLQNIAQEPGQPVSKYFSGIKWRQKRTFYNRIAALEAEGYISVDRAPRKFNFLNITDLGRAALQEAKA